MQNLDINRGKLLPRQDKLKDPDIYAEVVRICDAYEERFKDLYNYFDRLCGPSYTTTERDALTAANGMLIYNTTDAKVQVYEDGGWRNA